MSSTIPSSDINSPSEKTLTYTLASRASQLAKIQTHIVRDALLRSFPNTAAACQYNFEESFMETAGDKNQREALYTLGGGGGGGGVGKSLWTEELQERLLRREGEEGRVDMLVHSLKDVPTVLPEECEIGAFVEREDPADALVVKVGVGYKGLDELPEGAVVGTSSVRRVAQLRRAFPALRFADVRGNLNTRLAKLDSPTGPYTALILAKAGLVRLGFGSRITKTLTPPTLYHAVGQGALAIEIRKSDASVSALCAALNHTPTEWRCRAERALLRVLEGGCSVPVGTSTSFVPSTNVDEDAARLRGRLMIMGTVTSVDGTRHVEGTSEAEVGEAGEAEKLGEELARKLVENGAREILNEIKMDKEARKAEAESTSQTGEAKTETA